MRFSSLSEYHIGFVDSCIECKIADSESGAGATRILFSDDSSDSWPCYHPEMHNLLVLIHLRLESVG